MNKYTSIKLNHHTNYYVSQSTINLQEDTTKVQPEEEATSTKPVSEGTENPLRIINLTHYNQDKTQPYPRNR